MGGPSAINYKQITKEEMSDTQTTIQDIKDLILTYRKRRGWVHEDPKDVALSVVLEAAELLEHFQFKSGEEVEHEAKLYGPICDEMADVLWWLVVMAERLDIDISEALRRKLAHNEEKYPEEIFASDMTDEDKRRAYYQIKAKYRGSHPLAEGEKK